MVKYPSTQGQQSQGERDDTGSRGRLLVLHPVIAATCPGDTDCYMMDINLPFFSIVRVIVSYDPEEKERQREKDKTEI